MNIKNLIFLVIALAAIYMLSTGVDFWSNSNSEVDRLEHEADSLRNIIIANQEKQAVYDKQIDSLSNRIDKLQITISNRESKIAELKRKSNETYTNIPKLTVNDIGQFLSSRYKDSTSTK